MRSISRMFNHVKTMRHECIVSKNASSMLPIVYSTGFMGGAVCKIGPEVGLPEIKKPRMY